MESTDGNIINANSLQTSVFKCFPHVFQTTFYKNYLIYYHVF